MKLIAALLGARKLLGASLATLSLVVLGACSSQNYSESRGHDAFRARDYVKAAEEFGKKSSEPGTNQFLYLVDEATSHFAARNYDAAIKAFLKAETIAEIKDYTSISEEVGTLVTSDNVRGYKGEDFEKVLINVYLALAYTAVGKIEDAQVEARKINLLLYRMIHEGKRNYQESPFARYLSAMLWESSGEWNSAYVDYKATYELDKNFPGLGGDLIGMAKKMRFRDEEERWRKEFPGSEARSLGKDQGELVVVFERGQSPVKTPRVGDNANLPRFVPRYSEQSGMRVRVGSSVYSAVQGLDVEGLSIRYLEDRIGRMQAAKIGGMALKGALAYGVGKATKNSDLGWLAFIALMASDQADLRSWRTLPKAFDIVRIPLRAGTYDFDVEVMSGNTFLYPISFKGVSVQAGRKTFINAR